MTEPQSIEDVFLNTTRLRQAREEDWHRLEELVALMEKRSVRSLDDDDLMALPVLYRGALSSLSVARETSLDRALIRYLEQLCTRAYFQIYGVQIAVWPQVRAFFAEGWPRAVRALWRETLASFGLTLFGALLGYFLVKGDPSWFYDLIPAGLAAGRDPSASAAVLRETLYHGSGDGFLGTMATALFTHNSQVALLAFALGFAFGLPTALLLVYNGVMLGAFFAVFVPKGLGLELGGWIAIHGTTELFAIILAGAAGFRIGAGVAFPGRTSRLDSAVEGGRTAGAAMIGVVLMLLIAGLLEGIGRQTIVVDWQRYLVGFTMLGGWLLYYYGPRRAR